MIYYVSKTLNNAQQNYTTTEKKFLVVVFTLKKFRPYLLGSKITVFTDHSTDVPHDKEGRESKTHSMDPSFTRV